MMIRTIFFLVFILECNLSFSQTICDSLITLKNDIYGFTPSELSDSLKSLKSKELDLFWETANSDPIDAASCLRRLIENETQDSYFCFNAASLLLRLDTSNKYLPTVITGLKKANLEDIQLSSYLQMCFYLGHKAQDITDLTIDLISIPDAKVFLHDHFLTLNAIDASLFLFNLMPISVAEDALISTVQSGNPIAKHNSAVVLNIFSTDNGDRLLDSLIEGQQLADSTVQFILKVRKTFFVQPTGSIGRARILEALQDVPYNFEKKFYGFAGNDKLIGSACKQLDEYDVDKIRDARRRSTPGLSDEALHEYFALTKILMTVRQKK